MNEREPELVTTWVFKGGDEYVVRMNVTTERGETQRSIELTVTNKHTAETWHSSYDTAYIENLTHKTGNFKQFNVFVVMLKSGLLKSRECITLDLLTSEDLKCLKVHRIDTNPNSTSQTKCNNRRYLILTYSVEFDRIHYALPLEYSGAPDPILLQATIRRLEAKIKSLESKESYEEYEKQIEELTAINQKLIQENQRLANGKAIKRLMADIKLLENCVAQERMAFSLELQKLQEENINLATKLHQIHHREMNNNNINNRSQRAVCTPVKKNIPRSPAPRSSQNRRCNSGLRRRSRSPSVTGQRKSSLTRADSMEILKIKDSARSVNSRSGYGRQKDNDLGNLELRINILRKMLEEGVKLN